MTPLELLQKLNEIIQKDPQIATRPMLVRRKSKRKKKLHLLSEVKYKKSKDEGSSFIILDIPSSWEEQA